MIRQITLLLSLFFGTVALSFADTFPYKNPTGNEFPILAWYSILGNDNLTPERYAELRNAGFNISFSHFSDAASVAKGLQASKGTGVKLMITCPELEGQTAEIVNRFKNDESVAGWFLRDEPTTHGFAELRKYRDRVYASDQEHLVYLNLLPSIVSPADLGTQTYEEYVQRFVDEVQLPQISYDFYPIVFEGKDKIVVRSQFYENLEAVRSVARRNKQPFWAFVLSTAHEVYPTPTAVHMRFEAFSALAYGTQCIQYFTYWTPGRDTWNFHNAPIAQDGRRTHVYWLVKRLNEEIQRLAWVFLGAEAVDVWHTGDTLPTGAQRLTSLPAPFTSVEADGQGVLVSHLKNGGKRFLMIMNRDINNAQNISLGTSKSVRQLYSDGKSRKIKGCKTTRFALAPAEYAIFRFE